MPLVTAQLVSAAARASAAAIGSLPGPAAPAGTRPIPPNSAAHPGRRPGPGGSSKLLPRHGPRWQAEAAVPRPDSEASCRKRRAAAAGGGGHVPGSVRRSLAPKAAGGGP